MLTVSFIGGRNLHGHMFIKSMSLCFAPLLEKHQIRTSYPVNWTISEYMYKPLHVRTSHVQTSTCTNLYMYKPHMYEPLHVRTSTCTNLTCTNLYMYEPLHVRTSHVRTSTCTNLVLIRFFTMRPEICESISYYITHKI
jgi:hypothetical protein